MAVLKRVTDSQIRSAIHLVNAGQPAMHVARDLGMSRATFTADPEISPSSARQQAPLPQLANAPGSVVWVRGFGRPTRYSGYICFL